MSQVDCLRQSSKFNALYGNYLKVHCFLMLLLSLILRLYDVADVVVWSIFQYYNLIKNSPMYISKSEGLTKKEQQKEIILENEIYMFEILYLFPNIQNTCRNHFLATNKSKIK